MFTPKEARKRRALQKEGNNKDKSRISESRKHKNDIERFTKLKLASLRRANSAETSGETG